MLKYIKKEYEMNFKEIFIKEEFYEYIIYCSRGMSNYKKYMVKYNSFEDFIIDIIDKKIDPYFLSLKDYILTSINKEMEYIKKNNIKILNINNPFYPKRLKKIKNAPRFIFYKGELSSYIKSIAVVGTRNYDRVGEMLARAFTREIVLNNINITSGAARGIDTISQKEALRNNGNIIMVLGVGLAFFLESYQGREYLKKENNILFLTEFPLFFKGNRQSFPIRNRIIAGLSISTIVIQAPIKSGALYTANYTLLQNKPLFFPLGEYFNNNFSGNIEFLKRIKYEDNIYLLTDIKEMIKLLKIENKQNKKSDFVEKKLDFKNSDILSSEEKEILLYIQNVYPDSIHFDELFNNYNMKKQEALTKFQSKLFNLMLNDFIVELAGRSYLFNSK